MSKVEMPCLGHNPSRVTFGVGDKPLCDGCGGSDGVGLTCGVCNLQAHEECIEWSLKFAGHSKHNLKKVSPGTLDYTNGKCHFCGEVPSKDFYHCSTCDFSIDEYCKFNAQCFVFNRRSHEHPFTLLPRKIPFICNACGLLGERNPYVCIECNLMIHRDCIDLPRVININRHDHRISLTYHLGRGNWESCGVCRKKIDWSFGAFYCKRCPTYAVHSKCATKFQVWDMKELEHVPEEEEEIKDPYIEINGEKEILHFSHEEHNLRLCEEDAADFEKIRCDACILPLNNDMFYKCVQCHFFLHKVCANLPRKKRHVLHTVKLYLQVRDKSKFQCSACCRYSEGFRYENHYFHMYSTPKPIPFILDARCGSISEPFHHELHPHPLYFTLEESKTCVACGVHSPNVLSCTVCDFALDIKCATLPTKVKHRCDDHFLSLCHGGENVTGELWCDICETKTDPKVWFYTCEDCRVTLHTKCVLGDLYYLNPRNNLRVGEDPFNSFLSRFESYIVTSRSDVIPNDGMTRPFCCICKLRCIFPVFMANPMQLSQRVCSLECLFSLRTQIQHASCSSSGLQLRRRGNFFFEMGKELESKI